MSLDKKKGMPTQDRHPRGLPKQFRKNALQFSVLNCEKQNQSGSVELH
jgi:hypothetical protein